MRTTAVASLLLGLALAAAGCSGSKPLAEKEDTDPEPAVGPDVEAVDTPEALLRASIQFMNALADVLGSIKDRDSARKAEPLLRILTGKAKALEAAAGKVNLADQPVEQLKALEERYKGEFEKARRRAEQEVKRLNADPELSKILNRIDLRNLLN